MLALGPIPDNDINVSLVMINKKNHVVSLVCRSKRDLIERNYWAEDLIQDVDDCFHLWQLQIAICINSNKLDYKMQIPPHKSEDMEPGCCWCSWYFSILIRRRSNFSVEAGRPPSSKVSYDSREPVSIFPAIKLPIGL